MLKEDGVYDKLKLDNGGSRFPENPNDLFPDDYAGLTKVEKLNGKIDFIVEAGDTTYKIEYHPKHEGVGIMMEITIMF